MAKGADEASIALRWIYPLPLPMKTNRLDGGINSRRTGDPLVPKKRAKHLAS